MRISVCPILAGKNSKGSGSSSEALDMQVRRSVSSPSAEAAAVGTAGGSSGKKKSILKKSDSGRGHLGSRGGSGGHRAEADPERETLLVSDESSNATPVAPRRNTAAASSLTKQSSLTAADLPPTANTDQLKALTGPKLRTGPSSGGGGMKLMSNNVLGNGNGTVASKEIQTSTGNLPTTATNNNISDLTSAAQQSSTTTSTTSNANRKFERGRELSEAGKGLVYKCPNDMCRHNKASTTSASGVAKKKICLCGRTMVSQVRSAAAAAIVVEDASGGAAPPHHQLNEETKLLTSTASKERIPSSS